MRISFCMIACLLLADTLRAADAPDPKQLELWVADLSAEEYEKRQQAEEHLRAAGVAAVPALEAGVAKTDDAELRERARKMIEDLTLEQRLAQAWTDLNAAEWSAVQPAVELLLNEYEARPEIPQKLAKTAEVQDKNGDLPRLMKTQLVSYDQMLERMKQMDEQNKENPGAREALRRHYSAQLDRLKSAARQQILDEAKKLIESRAAPPSK
ncbi:MAG: hypothetical protein HS116_06720 [Planctomycetes bacterium]|nr:hypothetical protein [Planctomycetota bacterium]